MSIEFDSFWQFRASQVKILEFDFKVGYFCRLLRKLQFTDLSSSFKSPLVHVQVLDLLHASEIEYKAVQSNALKSIFTAM